MINVDIYFPALDKTYDFQVDEHVPVGAVIEEIAEMIGNGTKEAENFSADQFMLCSMETEQILRKSVTLHSCKIRNGARLMIV